MLDKVDGLSMNLEQANMDRLRAVFPECFAEGKLDIDKLLAACDCVISSSRQEGLPMNLIEAAASGRYIIATDVRGNTDVVRQSGFGTLVKLNDDAAMAEEIRGAMMSNCHPHMERIQLFNENEIVNTVMRLYSNS